ncbi:DNA polymerase-3 subunit epsilon [Oscillibacter sp. PC13]|uniref:3'-5' exonuclease n=1 Tax=Oscillibacter sp. PC13 TaxID=1855299 RepID=UPI0008ECEC78|nr:3'-5' exonuclease [Oscillibacter sp. PC13]SFP43561.1 DNA polymerase-3 subunit epsilon [Oscillibacter sp. PC13]
MEDLLEQFDRIVIFDTETTGIEFGRDEIIELGAVCLGTEGETDSMNCLLRLTDGRVLPPFITELTGITDAQLAAEGVEKEEASRQFCRLLDGAERPLLVAYNAQFDLNFLYYFLRPFQRLDVLKAARFLDALTVYRDRRDYPHKLCNAIAAYGLEDQAVNSHRAVDDARAAAMLLFAMAAEKNDLLQYLDLFGYNARYGVSGRKISSVTYRAQPYQRTRPLYELSADTL